MSSDDPSTKRATVENSVALVTGANSGIGLGFVKVLLSRGAKRVYAAARRPETLAEVVALDPARVVALELDVNNDAHRRAAAAKATDVTWLINNAGIAGSPERAERRFMAARSLDDAKLLMDTNCWSPAELARLFAPIIVDNGGGAIVQILSVGALGCVPEFSSYSASKAAAAMMIAGIRAELDRHPVLVASVFTSSVQSGMTAAGASARYTAEEHAVEVLDEMAEGATEIYSSGGKEYLATLRADPKTYERVRIDRLHSSPLDPPLFHQTKNDPKEAKQP